MCCDMTWQVVTLVLGLTAIAGAFALAWRVLSVRGVRAAITADLLAHRAEIERQLDGHRSKLKELEAGTNAYIAQTTQQIRQLENSMGGRGLLPSARA